jgi:hypothetical protein
MARSIFGRHVNFYGKICTVVQHYSLAFRSGFLLGRVRGRLREKNAEGRTQTLVRPRTARLGVITAAYH